MKKHCNYEIIGQTQDDAVGEAFDKVARLLGLGYPGGPIISERASLFEKSGTKNDIELPQPMKHSGDYNFSFSGIKTAVLYLVKNYRKENNLSDEDKLPKDFVNAVANAFQNAVVEILTQKTINASIEHNIKTILLAGGVSANKQLRESLENKVSKIQDMTFNAPQFEYCLDNAAMIAIAAYYRWNNQMSQNDKIAIENGWLNVSAHANFQLS